MPKRNELDEYADTAVLPHEGSLPELDDAWARTMTMPDKDRAREPEASDIAVAEAHARYEEYLRTLDDVPVLCDIVCEPPRTIVRDFLRGERPDARRHAREDPYTLREEHARELEQRYSEYVEIFASAIGPTRPRGARKTVPTKARSSRPKRSTRR